MSISAISSDYSYFQKYQTQFFGGTISASQFESLAAKYGIAITGNSYSDVQNLYQAMLADADAEVIGSIASQKPQGPPQSQQVEAQSSSNCPWASLMNRVGLSATGKLAEDLAAFNSKISAMQSSGATSGQDQALIAQLSTQASSVFVVIPQAQQPQGAAQIQAISGADIRAQLNRLYFFS